MKCAEFDIEERAERAVRNFESGYNCAQSVFLAYADLFGLELEQAKMMSVSFGGGMGRMREVCGTVSATAMLIGFRYPVEDPSDMEARTRNYAMTQKAFALFKKRFGTYICRELLPPEEQSTTPKPSERTAAYYAKRPCAKFVRQSALNAGAMLKGEWEEEA